MKSEISNPAIKKAYAKIRKTALQLKKLCKQMSILIAKELAKQNRKIQNSKSKQNSLSTKKSKVRFSKAKKTKHKF